MKIRVSLASVAALLLGPMVAMPASADVLYENGPINGSRDTWAINFGFVVSNTFTISSANSTITGIAFGAWLLGGGTLESVEVSFTSQEFGGTTYFDQIMPVTASGCSHNQYGYNICTETGSFTGVSLAEGISWINLQNAVVNTGDPVFWDENSGEGCHSPGCPSKASENTLGTIPSEAFTLFGSTSNGSVPEPGSLLLLVSGMAVTAGIGRCKFR